MTLTGLGGGGKTRLAEEIACGLWDAYTGRVWFVALAGLPDASLLDVAVRDGLHLPAATNAAPLEQIVGFLAEAPALLILDNFETLLPAGAAWVAMLLFRLPRLGCLVTSRQRLEIEGEEQVPLLPLPTPRARNEALDVPQLARFPGVRLFVTGRRRRGPILHSRGATRRRFRDCAARSAAKSSGSGARPTSRWSRKSASNPRRGSARRLWARKHRRC